MKLKLTQKNFLPLSIGTLIFLIMAFSFLYSVYMFFAVIGSYVTAVGIVLLIIHINDRLPKE